MEEGASKIDTGQLDRADWTRKTMSEVEGSSSGHLEDVATTVVSEVLARGERDQGLTNNAAYVDGLREVKLARGCANLPVGSPNAMIHPEEVWLADRILAVNTQACRLDQE